MTESSADVITFVVNWRDIAGYALAFAGTMLLLFVSIAGALAKWGVDRVLAVLTKIGERLDKLEEHVDARFLGLDRRVTRIETKVGLPTPVPGEDDIRGYP